MICTIQTNHYHNTAISASPFKLNIIMIVTFNKNIVKDIISKSGINLNIEKVVWCRFDNYKHKTVIAYKANTASGLAYKGIKNFPVEGIISYNKGNNTIVLFRDCYLVWDNTLNSHRFFD